MSKSPDGKIVVNNIILEYGSASLTGSLIRDTVCINDTVSCASSFEFLGI